MSQALVSGYRALSFAPRLQRFALRRANTLYLVGVLGLVTDEHGRLLLFHHTYRDRHAWGLPGGWIARGERPAGALEREIREESGLQVRPGCLHQVLFEDAGPWVEIVLRAALVGGSFTPSAEVDQMVLAGPDDIPGDVRPSHRKMIDELLQDTSR